MYCSRLSVLKELLNEADIEKIEIYFSTLIGSAKTSITVSKVVEATNIPANLVIKALTKCKENGLLDVAYSIRCPNCEMLIKKVLTLAEIPQEPFECYNCEEEIEIQPEFIEVIYSLVDDNCVFIEGQQNDSDTSARSVAPENSMAQIFQAGGINEYPSLYSRSFRHGSQSLLRTVSDTSSGMVQQLRSSRNPGRHSEEVPAD